MASNLPGNVDSYTMDKATLAAIAMDGVAFRERQHHAQHLQQTCGRQAFLEEALQAGDEGLLKAELALGRRSTRPASGATPRSTKPLRTDTRAWWAPCWKPALGERASTMPA